MGGGVGLGRLERGDPVSTRVARRLACDAVLQRVVSTPSLGPLDVGREHRLVTLAQRRALAARDGDIWDWTLSWEQWKKLSALS